MTGPLGGLTVIELAGLGPAPFAGMVLADLGATVVRVDRVGVPTVPLPPRDDLQGRGKRSIAVDLKRAEGAALVRTLATRADVLVEGFRPGVAERLGVGPAQCHAVNPRLVYGRITGWGQDGPLADTAGHDITYLARTGILHAIGPAGGAPVPPLNLLGDYGGGGMLLVAGVLAALWQAQRTGVGQVVDAAIVDGATLLATQLYGLLHSGLWQDRRGANLLDGGAPFYGVYETADARHLAVGPLEPKFYAEFAARLGLDPEQAPGQLDVESWPRLRALIAARVATRTRAEWTAIFAEGDGCAAPVLSLEEAPTDPQLRARGTFVQAHGVRQPAPAPRFSATPAAPPALPPPLPGEHTREVLQEWAITDAEALISTGVAHQAGQAPGAAGHGRRPPRG